MTRNSLVFDHDTTSTLLEGPSQCYVGTKSESRNRRLRCKPMATSVASALQKLLPSSLPPSLSSRPGNLYQVLSRYSKDGVGQRVHQVRWGSKGIEDCYWEVTRTRLKLGGKHGKAWGKLVWKGALTSSTAGLKTKTDSSLFRKRSQHARRGDSWRAQVHMGPWSL